MKKLITDYLPYVIIILLIIWGKGMIDKKDRLVEAIETKDRVYAESITQWIDKAGRHRAQANISEVRKEEAEIVYKKEIDALKTEIKGLKIRNLRSSTQVSTTTEGTVEVQLVRDTVFVSDSTGVQRFLFEDPYLYLEGELAPLANKLSINYRITNSLRLVEYRKKSGFLGLKRESVVEAISENPNTTITGLTTLTIKPTQKTFNLVLYVGYGINSQGLSPSIGLGIGYKLL